MTIVTKIVGDLAVSGNVTIGGDVPLVARSRLVQENEVVYPVNLVDFRVHDALATNLPGTSATDDLALSGGTFGTNSPKLTTGDVKASTVTRYARALLKLPAEYVAAQTVKLRISAGMETTVADTSATVDVVAYKSDREGGIGSDLCSTAAQSMNAIAFSDKDFVIDGSGLSAGDILDVRIAVAVTDGATATAVIASIGAVELLADVKG